MFLSDYRDKIYKIVQIPYWSKKEQPTALKTPLEALRRVFLQYLNRELCDILV